MIATLSSAGEFIDTTLGPSRRVTEQNSVTLKKLLNRDSAIKIVQDILSTPELVQAIARRSYRHTLGFDKLVLLDPGVTLTDGSRGFGFHLRLHIWWPGSNSGVPVVEGMHEHTFDFVSTVLAGAIENQRFLARPLTPQETAVLAKLDKKLAALLRDEVSAINDRLEALMAGELEKLGSSLPQAWGGMAQLEKKGDRKGLAAQLGMTDEEMDAVLYLHGRFINVTGGLNKGGYIHQLQETVRLEPLRVDKIAAGETYFHPHQHIHRLFNQDTLQSTILVTTPVSQEAQGGSLQRPSYVAPTQENADVTYTRRMYTPEELADILTRFLKVV